MRIGRLHYSSCHSVEHLEAAGFYVYLLATCRLFQCWLTRVDTLGPFKSHTSFGRWVFLVCWTSSLKWHDTVVYSSLTTTAVVSPPYMCSVLLEEKLQMIAAFSTQVIRYKSRFNTDRYIKIWCSLFRLLDLQIYRILPSTNLCPRLRKQYDTSRDCKHTEAVWLSPLTIISFLDCLSWSYLK